MVPKKQREPLTDDRDASHKARHAPEPSLDRRWKIGIPSRDVDAIEDEPDPRQMHGLHRRVAAGRHPAPEALVVRQLSERLLRRKQREFRELCQEPLLLLGRELDNGAGPEIQGLVPPGEFDANGAEDERQRSYLEQGDGEVAAEAAEGANDEDEYMAEGDEASEVVGLAALFEVFKGRSGITMISARSRMRRSSM